MFGWERPAGPRARAATTRDGTAPMLGLLTGPGPRRSQEFQSALVRLAAWAAMVAFLGAGGLSGHYRIDWGLYVALFGVHLIWFLGLLLHVAYRPALSPRRTYVAIAADLSAITLLIYLSGELLAPFYLVYVLSFLSQGTRYGRRNLIIASVGSLLCYGAIATVMDGWGQHALEVSFVLTALVVLPLYQYNLLRNLQRARRDAEVASSARGRFLATMSHELRTPLSGVVGMARLLDGTNLDAEQRRYVDSICAAADTLQGLIGDILDLSKVDAGMLELTPRWLDLRDSVHEVCSGLAPQALDKGVELVCRIDGTLPARIHVDPVRFQQILYNLVGNAVKFTDHGRVRVAAEPAPGADPEAPADLLVTIDDTGIGIPAGRLDCVFDGFWQADRSPDRRHGGAGLGTTIAHRLAMAMGGGIEVESVEGEGSTFRVRLPVLAGAGASAPAPPAALAGRGVLVCEPDPVSRRALSAACRGAGMRVLACSEPGTLATAQARSAAPELLLVADCPRGRDLGGVTRALRRALGRDLPAVYLHCRGHSPAATPDGLPVVLKPFHPVELWQAMAAALGLAPAAPAAAPLRARPTPAPAARILVAEDDDINACLVETLLTRCGHEVTVVGDGPAALARLDAEPYDLVLADVRMPGMDGAQLARAVRARADGRARVPIVALTANAAAETRAECLQAGMDAFLVKPVDPDALADLLRRFTAKADA